MDKQFSIYSINFRAFYTDEEMEISNKILKTYNQMTDIEKYYNFISQNYNISKKEAYDEIYNLFTRNLQSHKPLSSDVYDELIESGYYNHNNKRVQFKDEFNSIVYKISEHINEKYKDKEFSEYLLEQSLI